MLPSGDAPMEIRADELKERGPNGERIVQPVLTVWNSAPRKEIPIVSERWEGCTDFPIEWESLLALHEAITRQIEILKPLVKAGRILVK